MGASLWNLHERKTHAITHACTCICCSLNFGKFSNQFDLFFFVPDYGNQSQTKEIKKILNWFQNLQTKCKLKPQQVHE